MAEEMIPVEVDSIRVSLVSPQRVVLLREKGRDRFLPIWIGPFEAEAIQIALQEVEVARPLTHDLLNSVFKALGAQVLRVEVVDLRDNVFYGNIVVELNGEIINIDSRPSDAIALAVRAHVPILVAQHVMEEAGIEPEEDISEPAAPQARKPTQAESAGESESSEDRLSIFADFLEKLELEDLDSESQTDEEDEEDEEEEDDKGFEK